MTREMEIEELQRHRQEFAHDHGWSGSVLDALDAAINALQTEQLKESQENFNKDFATESMLNADLISRQAAIDAVRGYIWAQNRIENLPSVTPQKVGRWNFFERREPQYDLVGVKTWAVAYKCSECGFIHTVIEDFGHYAYCPNCGAKMEEGED